MATITGIDYSRTGQTAFGREAVRQLKVVIVGAGAIGNQVATALGLLGCGEVVVIDRDVVEAHNLPTSVFFRTSDAVGVNKAASLVNACNHYFRDTFWTSLETEVADAGFGWIERSDLVFCCVDNELARLETAYACAKFDRPLCDAGLGGENHSKIRVSFFPGRNCASFCCLLPPARRRELLTLWECRSHPCWPSEPEAAFSGTPMAAAVAGSIQVDVGLRLLATRHEHAAVASSIEFALDSQELSRIRIPLSPACPFHMGPLGESVLEAADSDLTVRELLRRLGSAGAGEPVLVLDWPLCVSAKCRDCGHVSSPMVRLAVLRRSAHCISCSSGRLVAMRTVHRLGRDSELAGYRLQDLGMPDRHIYTIEFQRAVL
jgi:adenylyltransferase/sulfurtransferase